MHNTRHETNMLPASSTWDEQLARQVYYAYGVDLVRTGGLLLHTTPSVIYRASVLLQRFEHSVDLTFRARYLTRQEMAKSTLGSGPMSDEYVHAQPIHKMPFTSGGRSASQSDGDEVRRRRDNLRISSSDEDEAGEAAAVASQGGGLRVPYRVPNHVGGEMRSGLAPLADLFAPLDYCVAHLIDQDDILFLAAACLLVAAKMEDPGVRIRGIVNVFMRLGQRRLGMPVVEFLKPSAERYDDFKTCVTEAEEVVLHQLGFQTYVESPYKYALVFLALLVDDVTDEVKEEGSSGGGNNGTGGLARAKKHSPAYLSWVSRAVAWLNDVPRCATLTRTPAPVLAAYALQWSTPKSVLLPVGWHTALGVSALDLHNVHTTYHAFLAQCGSASSPALLATLRERVPRLQYYTCAEAAALLRLSSANDERGSKPASPRPLTPSAPAAVTVPHVEGGQEGLATCHTAVSSATRSVLGEALRVDAPVLAVAGPATEVTLAAPAATVAPEPPMEFEDLREMQRRRRLEEERREREAAARQALLKKPQVQQSRRPEHGASAAQHNRVSSNLARRGASRGNSVRSDSTRSSTSRHHRRRREDAEYDRRRRDHSEHRDHGRRHSRYARDGRSRSRSKDRASRRDGRRYDLNRSRHDDRRRR